MQNERSKKPELSAVMKDDHQQHREQHDNSREPLLNGLTSEFDLKLFREAQMIACEQMVGVLSYTLPALFDTQMLLLLTF